MARIALMIGDRVSDGLVRRCEGGLVCAIVVWCRVSWIVCFHWWMRLSCRLEPTSTQAGALSVAWRNPRIVCPLPKGVPRVILIFRHAMAQKSGANDFAPHDLSMGKQNFSAKILR
jgi:hypothetical protein